MLSQRGLKIKVKTLIFNFKCNGVIKGSSDKIRGYFAERFADYILIHHHLNGRFLYKSPLIQYKLLDDNPFVLGINEGAEILQKIYGEINLLRIGKMEYEITEKTIVLKTDKWEITDADNCYSFITPWLALNEKNYEKYQKLGTWVKRKELLESILVGNIISISKSLGYTVPAPIAAHIIKIKQVRTLLKGTLMLGFLGNFSVNFEIPDYWGIGKSVSRGFGTVIRQKTEIRCAEGREQIHRGQNEEKEDR